LDMMEAPVVSEQSAALLNATRSSEPSSQCCRPSLPSGNGQPVIGDAVLEGAANEDVRSEANEMPNVSACWSAAATIIAAVGPG
jgi:hypothetical protein